MTPGQAPAKGETTHSPLRRHNPTVIRCDLKFLHLMQNLVRRRGRMLSSIGLGSLNTLFQPNLSASGGASASGSSNQVSKSSSSDGETSSGASPAPAAESSGAASSAPPSAQAAVTASQAVQPVTKSASGMQSAYVQREAASSDSETGIAAATQRQMFRAQLIDRIGQESEARDLSVKEKASAEDDGLGKVQESEMDYSY
ncbi:hypothetical protein [Pseudooceanicola sp. LIPI14-2-Ac024]|uniref:hypothetical protein n=1 Tax=Pseudooceanicola sp. LIPI14-2-Ac024 TaxID=3344875 RepID=UPI0035D0868B